MEIIQYLLVLFVLFALSRAYLRFKERKIKIKEFIFWLLVWVFAIITVLVPSTAGNLSKILGIGRPADLIIYLAIILLFYLIFRAYVFIDSVEEKITKIVREVAIQRKKKK
ncbi:DUF2304 family protein [Candidatus Woesearchaeota archaeon]|nr:DUF2304 family protein [Candidatus Woesearchaeota archaeon]